MLQQTITGWLSHEQVKYGRHQGIYTLEACT